jgi:hypothetical protein
MRRLKDGAFDAIPGLKGMILLLDRNYSEAQQEFTKIFTQKNRERLLWQVAKDYMDNAGRCVAG